MFDHEIELKLQQGEYTFELGFAAVPRAVWEQRHNLGFDDWNVAHETLAVITQAGAFSIGLAVKSGRSVLTHHGVADLPGAMVTWLIDRNE